MRIRWAGSASGDDAPSGAGGATSPSAAPTRHSEELLTRRLEAVERAESRLRDGTFGRSVLSKRGEPIPDGRLRSSPGPSSRVAEQSAH